MSSHEDAISSLSRSSPSDHSSHSSRAHRLGAGYLGRILEGRYRLDRVLGSGGLAVVFEASQLELGRRVAVKIMRADRHGSPQLLARLRREARAIAEVDHPNVIELYDVGETPEGEVYLVMELVEGETLATLLLREGALAAARAQDIAQQVLAALAEVHHRGIVHRDLKPSNLMVRRTATGDDHVTLLDFGIVKTTDREDVRLTKTGCIVGSPQYMAPEQVTGVGLSARTDLYAFGCVAHEMLTGRRVFADATRPVDAVLAHLNDEAPTPTRDGRPVSGALADLAMLCLNKAPEQRPPSARAALRLLRRRPAEPTRSAARPPALVRQTSPPEAAMPIRAVVPQGHPAVSAAQATATHHAIVRSSRLGPPCTRPDPGPRSRLRRHRVARVRSHLVPPPLPLAALESELPAAPPMRATPVTTITPRRVASGGARAIATSDGLGSAITDLCAVCPPRPNRPAPAGALPDPTLWLVLAATAIACLAAGAGALLVGAM